MSDFFGVAGSDPMVNVGLAIVGACALLKVVRTLLHKLGLDI